MERGPARRRRRRLSGAGRAVQRAQRTREHLWRGRHRQVFGRAVRPHPQRRVFHPDVAPVSALSRPILILADSAPLRCVQARLTFLRTTRIGTEMKAALLPERGVVKVAGEDARKFLDGLLTADVDKVTPQRAAFAALLTPQGKIMVDMIVAENPAADGGGYFLDVPRALAPTLAQRLNFYRLRAKVIVEDLSEMLGVLAAWEGAGATECGLLYGDPR